MRGGRVPGGKRKFARLKITGGNGSLVLVSGTMCNASLIGSSSRFEVWWEQA